MNKLSILILTTFSISCYSFSGDVQPTDNNCNIMTISGLSGDDFLDAAGVYKHESEHGHDMYVLEYKFAMASAELGNKEAKLWLGEMYQGNHVHGVAGNAAVDKAIHYWKQAAEAGQPRGFTDIGLLYMHKEIPGGGRNFDGVPLDYVRGISYLDKAVDLGDFKAPRYLGLLYLEGKGPVAKDEVKATLYFKKAAELGDSTGTMYYANALLNGYGIEKNVDKAIDLYQSVIKEKGHDAIECAEKLEQIYSTNRYGKYDLDKKNFYHEKMEEITLNH
jgi:uncharacterized protein